jgi:antitoxin YefM
METTNATELRKNLKRKLDAVSKDRETIIIHRSGEEDIIMLPISEYNSWKETMYLVSTRANRKNLEKSIEQAGNGDTERIEIDELWK